MYSIGEVAQLTGITAFTLRYYEKIGILPKPRRLDGKHNGIRRYDDQDLRFIQFIHGLKDTGMKLADIAAIAEDGCLLTETNRDKNNDIQGTLLKRIEIIDEHIHQMEQQMKQMEAVKAIAKEKRAFYSALLKEQASEELES
jgi:DNA-binding transcriptional MerR regulator